MKLTENDYSLDYNENSKTVKISGRIRLPKLKDYDRIKRFLNETADIAGNNSITLDLQDLDNINSSGITILSTFTIGLRKANKPGMEIISNSNYEWQRRTISTFKELWNKVNITAI